MTHLEELRQQEKELLEGIWASREMTSPSTIEATRWVERMRTQLRMVRTELSLIEQKTSTLTLTGGLID